MSSQHEAEVKPVTRKRENVPQRSQSLRPCHLYRYILDGIEFQIPRRYKIIQKIGNGAYGLVACGYDLYTKKKVAIKKISNVFKESKEFQKRILREILILNHFKSSDNIVKLLDVVLPVSYSKFNHVYIIMEFMDSDMKSLLASGQQFEDMAVKYFMYQLLRGLLTLQTAGVLHRDIKPGNILINSEMDVKICDFGISRGYSMEVDPEMSTKYVSTRWYRAPELLFLYEKAGPEIDIWSLACIFAELLANPHLPYRKRVLFPGRSYFAQIDIILETLGKPDLKDVCGCNRAIEYVKSFQPWKKSNQITDWGRKFPKANPEGLDLLDKMLQINPQKRITVEEAMKHPYLREIYEEDKLKESRKFDFRMTKIPAAASIKRMIFDFIVLWNKRRNGYGSVMLEEKEIIVKAKNMKQ